MNAEIHLAEIKKTVVAWSAKLRVANTDAERMACVDLSLSSSYLRELSDLEQTNRATPDSRVLYRRLRVVCNEVRDAHERERQRELADLHVRSLAGTLTAENRARFHQISKTSSNQH